MGLLHFQPRIFNVSLARTRGFTRVRVAKAKTIKRLTGKCLLSSAEAGRRRCEMPRWQYCQYRDISTAVFRAPPSPLANNTPPADLTGCRVAGVVARVVGRKELPAVPGRN